MRSMIRIGKIVATHGIAGSLIMTHVVGASKWLKKDTTLMVEMHKGSFIPYFVTQVKALSDKEYLINIEDIDKVESAKKLVTKAVYIDEALLGDFAKKTPLLWIGFKIIDKQLGNIGAIEDVLQTGSQWLGKIIHNEKEVLIPLIPEMIKHLDIKTKTIKMDLPDGLLEL